MPGNRKKTLADVTDGAYSPLDYAVTSRDKSTMDMVAAAIRHKQVLLAYQPVMQARAQDQVALYGGLVRVLDETGSVIPAREFIDAIEDNELGRQLDTLALGMGLRALDANEDLRLSIDMSARSIGYQAWNRVLDRWLSRNPTIAERLMLEISEASAMTVPELVVDFMDRLQIRGISFAMDDFGAGFTALRYFKHFCFDMVKIDGQFVRGVSECPDNQAMMSALISIAKQFDMITIAEFVETQQDADMLASLGVDCLQGHLFGAATTRPHWLTEKAPREAV